MLASLLSFLRKETRAAGRAFGAGTQRADINLEFLHGAAEGVAVHIQLPRGFALVAPIFFEHGHNKTLLEFTDRFRVENIAFIHLKNKRFQLIFHLLPRFRTFTT
jgi:hypothetical protein